MSFDTWRNANVSGGISQAQRAADAWARINRDPHSIIIVRDGTPLAAQTMRVEYSTSVNVSVGDGMGRSAMTEVWLLGIRNHATLSDTDIQRDDRFALDGQTFRVETVMHLPGEIQAKGEAIS